MLLHEKLMALSSRGCFHRRPLALRRGPLTSVTFSTALNLSGCLVVGNHYSLFQNEKRGFPVYRGLLFSLFENLALGGNLL